MKQLIQTFRNGQRSLHELPVPVPDEHSVLIRSVQSLVSPGTERMLVEFADANLIKKVIQQPDRVAQVLNKLKSDGLRPTLNAVTKKLNEDSPLGYCNVGVVEEIGSAVSTIKVGDRVVSNGHHAELVCVPENLCARIPDGVDDDEAVFTVIGAIALQGIRLSEPTFGETVVVFGLGLVGLVATQLLVANGCRVIGIDNRAERVALGKKHGLVCISSGEQDPVAYVHGMTNLVGADSVIITANSSSDELVAQAAHMSRQRGRIVLVGVTGLNLSRADFYEKELTFQVSCSYGPGRHDESYESKGRDYPLGYVRWTERRNFEAVLEAIKRGVVTFKPLVTARVAFHNFEQVYADLGNPHQLASLLIYDNDGPVKIERSQLINKKLASGDQPSVAVVGAGNYVSVTLLPVLSRLDVDLDTIVSARGVSAAKLARQYGFCRAASAVDEIMDNEAVRIVIIATRHHLHSPMAIRSLESGKHVFVEKPLCLRPDELEDINAAHASSSGTLSVGFNRRHSVFAARMRDSIASSQCNLVITVNAGAMPKDSWVQDKEIGGGRLIGEVCHFLDLCSFLGASPIRRVCANTLGVGTSDTEDNICIMVSLANGSQATINYFSNGHRSLPKETIQAYYSGKVLTLDNWRSLRGYGTSVKLSKPQDKGHDKQFRLFLESVQAGSAFVPYEQIVNVTEATFACEQSIRERRWIEVPGG